MRYGDPPAAEAPVAVAAPVVPAAGAADGPSPALQAAAVNDSMPAIQLPPNAPPLGFEGYCPVTMKRDWKWALGDTKWGAIHRGRTYLFATQADRQTFLADPDKYSPAMSGADPVLALETGKQTSGLRRYALEYQGKFYLFSSEQTLNKFWSNAEGYAQGVRQAMQGRSPGPAYR
ncbi:MAG: hypothetical protein AAF790_12260 [Planctomycetota bacterium]